MLGVIAKHNIDILHYSTTSLKGQCGRLLYIQGGPLKVSHYQESSLKEGWTRPLIARELQPISNLSAVSKILERLVLTRLRSHLLESTNFSKYQSAYRKGHSTVTTLLEILDGVYTLRPITSRSLSSSICRPPSMQLITSSCSSVSSPSLAWLTHHYIGSVPIWKVAGSLSSLPSTIHQPSDSMSVFLWGTHFPRLSSKASHCLYSNLG